MTSENESLHQTISLYEKEVQEYLGANLGLLGSPRLQLVQLEYPVNFGRDSGRIDILATDSRGAYVVIEVKRGVAGRGAVGQLQSYMGAVLDANPGKHVRGILVAMGIDDAANAALRMTHSIDFFYFQNQFTFHLAAAANAKLTAPKFSVSLVEPNSVENHQGARFNYWEKLGGTVLADEMDCLKCGKHTRVVKIGPQFVCGICGNPRH